MPTAGSDEQVVADASGAGWPFTVVGGGGGEGSEALFWMDVIGRCGRMCGTG